MAKMHKDDYYMTVARATALRGTCDRRQVGALVVADDRILSTGFNGAPSGLPECDYVGHLMVDGHCVRTIHAEANAILEVGGDRIRRFKRDGCIVTLYTTTFPCQWCTKLAIQAGIQRIVYGDDYSDPTHLVNGMTYAFEATKMLGIKLEAHPVEGIK